MPKQQNLEFPTFCPIVCERIRRLTAERMKLEKRREKAFKDRDGADAELEDLGPKETARRERLLAEWGSCEREVKRLNHAIKAVQGELDATVVHADQRELFPDPGTFLDPEKQDQDEDIDDPEGE